MVYFQQTLQFYIHVPFYHTIDETKRNETKRNAPRKKENYQSNREGLEEPHFIVSACPLETVMVHTRRQGRRR